MKRRFLLVLMVLIAAGGLLLSSCEEAGNDDSGGGGFTVSGTLNHNTATNGTKAYAKLVAPGGNEQSQALYFASTSFSGNEATYTVSGIAGGTYNLYCFVDLDGNAAGDSSSMPDSGDDYIYELNVAINADLTGQDVETGDWIRY